ncbi:hypothetical protein [Pseudonocardia parietis]|uniref:Uncharacterized protein n=1 Tax=Pseudonocardia parietis TaxID=570936 RepID=A0ABS4VMP2_9PSEU|nr:hypothetical protein [Pseudonocardia parietis]MBP2365170.1 hypothetical protein [Pseudonocardia parietis]
MTDTVGRELRISFRQFDGAMLGRCWCGRTYSSSDPRDMWAWLDDHAHAGLPSDSGAPGGPHDS